LGEVGEDGNIIAEKGNIIAEKEIHELTRAFFFSEYFCIASEL
jgi:hypothetical protein